MTLSPDGNWLWDGNEWIPAPPQVPPSAVNKADKFLETTSQSSGVAIDELRSNIQHFDLNHDGVLQREEVEQAAYSMQNPPQHFNNQGIAYAPDFKSKKTKLLVIVTILALLVSSSLFFILTPSNSPLDSIRDSDSDGYNDDIDVFDNDPSEWYDNDGDGYGNNQDSCIDEFGSSTIDRIGCPDSDFDGYSDENDSFPANRDEWLDSDEDGWGDNQDDCVNSSGTSTTDLQGCPDADDDGWSDSGDAFPQDATQWSDTDGDGFGDNPNGNNPDLFPDNPNEWSDTDEDGFGDNSDLDDDNDGVPDVDDLNPGRDAALFLNLSTFAVYEKMDYFDNYAEVYFCVYVNSVSEGCVPDQNSYWSLNTGTNYLIDSTYFIDLDETIRTHYIQIEAWDSDAFDDDLIDISSDPDWSSLIIEFDSVVDLQPMNIIGDGTQDSTGWDGELALEIQPIDNRGKSVATYNWDFYGDEYDLTMTLDYNTYATFRSLNHQIDWSGADELADVIDQYAAFADTQSPYIQSLALELESMAVNAGYASELDIADFIHAFVGDIQYQFDLDMNGDQTEYPKYPIEMLWDMSGDCEDAALLYISLVEALGYDAALMIGEVKQNSDEDWGGHAWAVIYIEDHSGDGFYGTGSKSEMPFYFVEATAHNGNSLIGENPWYDVVNYAWFDIE